MFLSIYVSMFPSSSREMIIPYDLKSSSNLKETKILSGDVFKKEKKWRKTQLNQEHVVWLSQSKQVASHFQVQPLAQYKVLLSRLVVKFHLLELEELSTTLVLFFTTYFLVALAPAFILLGFASNSFHFCVQIFFVAPSISFEMFLIA